MLLVLVLVLLVPLVLVLVLMLLVFPLLVLLALVLVLLLHVCVGASAGVGVIGDASSKSNEAIDSGSDTSYDTKHTEAQLRHTQAQPGGESHTRRRDVRPPGRCPLRGAKAQAKGNEAPTAKSNAADVGS